jgi:hypothetical protein
MLVRFFLSADDTFEPGSDTTLADQRNISIFASKKIKPGKTRRLGLKKLVLASDSSGLFVHAVDDNNCLIATAQIP